MKALEAKAATIPYVGGPIAGPGSQKHIDKVLEESCLDIPSLTTTSTLRKISNTDDNRNTILIHLPPSSNLARFIRAIDSHKKHGKLVNSYLKPYLEGKKNDHSSRIITVNGHSMMYPSWYIVPMKFDDRDASEGGTNQCRITPKRPALQTAPDPIRGCYSSRYGALLYYDLSQIEYRVAGLLSGDHHILNEYRSGNPDFHRRSAAAIYNIAFDDVTPPQRQVGKTQNFLMIFRGGADELVKMIYKRAGLRVTRGWALGAIDAYWSRYLVLKSWQDDLIYRACTDGHIELPILGQSRHFMGNNSDEIREVYTSTIVNFPVQATAALILICAQFEILDAFRRHHLRAVMPLQVYDSIYIDCPPIEVPCVDYIVGRALKNNWYFRVLCDHLGRTIPIEYDRKRLI
jgi:hypothetical protein